MVARNNGSGGRRVLAIDSRYWLEISYTRADRLLAKSTVHRRNCSGSRAHGERTLYACLGPGHNTFQCPYRRPLTYCYRETTSCFTLSKLCTPSLSMSFAHNQSFSGLGGIGILDLVNQLGKCCYYRKLTSSLCVLIDVKTHRASGVPAYRQILQRVLDD